MKIGLIGCGGMGCELARAAIGIEGVRLVAVHDAAVEATAAAAAAFDAEAMSDPDGLWRQNDVDAVIIATPPFQHADYCIAAARSGKHVFVEKPLATTVADCDALIEAVADTGVRVMVGQVCRFFEVHAAVRTLVCGGAIGDPILISVHRIHGPWGLDADPQHWRLSRKRCGGSLMEINAHEIDFMRCLCGDVATVSAAGGTYVQYGADYPDVAAVTMRFASGAIGLLHASQVSALNALGGRVDGTLGSIHFPKLFGCRGDITFKRWDGGECPIDLTPEADPRNPYQDELTAWIDAIREQRDPPITLHDGRMAVAIAEAAYASIESKNPVVPR